MASVIVYAKEGIMMQKDSTRDYITAAFRLYSALGCPSEQKIGNLSLSNSKIKSNKNSIAIRFDLLAVSKTLEYLNRSGKDYICETVREVYFTEPTREFKRNDINARVLNLAAKKFTSERNVWRWLKEARNICASFRGLNTATIEQIIDNN